MRTKMTSEFSLNAELILAQKNKTKPQTDINILPFAGNGLNRIEMRTGMIECCVSAEAL